MVEFLKAAGFWQEGGGKGGEGGHSYCTAVQLPFPAAAGVQRTLLISTALVSLTLLVSCCAVWEGKAKLPVKNVGESPAPKPLPHTFLQCCILHILETSPGKVPLRDRLQHRNGVIRNPEGCRKDFLLMAGAV